MIYRRTLLIRCSAILLMALLTAAHLSPALAAQRRSDAQTANQVSGKKFDLTIDNIMRGPELVGYEPRAVRWVW